MKVNLEFKFKEKYTITEYLDKYDPVRAQSILDEVPIAIDMLDDPKPTYEEIMQLDVADFFTLWRAYQERCGIIPKDTASFL